MTPRRPPADYADLRGLIAVTRELLRQQPENRRARAFIQWADSFDGRTPTDAEFAAWCRARGVRLRGKVAKE